MISAIANNGYLFFSAVLISSVLSSSLGVGSFILLPLAALAYGPKQSVGIITIYFLFQNINKLIVFWKDIHWKIGLKMILWSLPGTLIGSYALSLIPADIFGKLLAIFILTYLANDVFKIIPKSGHNKTTIPLFGLLYGLMSGLTGSGNLVKGPLFTSMGLVKEGYVATYALTSFFTNIPKIWIYYSTGIIDESTFGKSLPFLFISIVGTYLGKKLLKKMHNDLFYYVVNIAFAFSAIALLL